MIFVTVDNYSLIILLHQCVQTSQWLRVLRWSPTIQVGSRRPQSSSIQFLVSIPNNFAHFRRATPGYPTTLSNPSTALPQYTALSILDHGQANSWNHWYCCFSFLSTGNSSSELGLASHSRCKHQYGILRRRGGSQCFVKLVSHYFSYYHTSS